MIGRYGVIVGDAGPFIPLVKHLREGKQLHEIVLKGFYKLDKGGRVIGKGIGRYPKTTKIPINSEIFREKKGPSLIISINLDNSCSRRCGYCSKILSRKRPPVEKVVKDIKQAMIYNIPIANLSVSDNNPFELKTLSYYKKIFERLDSPLFFNVIQQMDTDSYNAVFRGDSDSIIIPLSEDDYNKIIDKTILESEKTTLFYKSAMIDPTALTEGNFENFLVFLFSHYFFNSILIGREVVTEAQAEVIGSNISGKPKTQKQLDSEKEAIKKLITAYDAFYQYFKVELDQPFVIKINYIYSPFETKKSALAKLSEAIEMYNMGTPTYISQLLELFLSKN